MYYKVKLKDPNNDKATSDGYLSNWLDESKPALYTRGEALKKAIAFNGKIEAVETTKNHKLSVLTEISAKDLRDDVRLLLTGRGRFIGVDLNKLIYDGNIFMSVLNELKELEKQNDDFKIKDEINEQLNELSQIVTSEFVLINDMCFS